MRHLLVLSSALTLACAAAGGASAQQAQTNGAGLRYLSWPGKPAPARTAPAPQTTVQDTTQVIPRPTQVAAVRDAALPPLTRIDAPPTPRRGLTPATAWTTPTRAPSVPASSTAQAYPAPSPQTEAAPEQPQVEAHAPPPPAEPQPMAEVRPQPQTEAPAAAEPAPQPAEDAAAVDPMAPRRDAAIFRLQRPQGIDQGQANAQPNVQTAQAAQPYQQSARYYSVHRQAGRHPDAIATPQPVYLDALPVEMSQTPASADLAQPDGPPALIRDVNGRVRPVPQSEPDTLP